MQFDYSLSLNGEEVSKEEWEALIGKGEELVEFRGQWVHIDPENMKKMLEFWNNNETEELNIRSFIDRSSHPEIELDEDGDRFMISLCGKQDFAIHEEPHGFNGKLRQYQKLGYSWMDYMERLGLNPCLADDMGLGKTIQVIALILHKREKDNLLVVPTSVVGNWEREISKFAPSLSTLIYHGNMKHDAILGYDIVLTTLTMVRRNQKIFSQVEWKRVILDEAQNIKNPKAKQTKVLVGLRSHCYVALTGTPIENSVIDLWSIF